MLDIASKQPPAWLKASTRKRLPKAARTPRKKHYVYTIGHAEIETLGLPFRDLNPGRWFLEEESPTKEVEIESKQAVGLAFRNSTERPPFSVGLVLVPNLYVVFDRDETSYADNNDRQDGG